MKLNPPLQCKDIPTLPILRFLAQRPGQWHNWRADDEKDVRRVMPGGTPNKLVLAKMRNLILQGVVKGCACGCRGDFEITEKGLEVVARNAAPSICPKGST